MTARAEDGPARRMTVEQAWLAKLRAAGSELSRQSVVAGSERRAENGAVAGAEPVISVPREHRSDPTEGRPAHPVIAAPERAASSPAAPRSRPSITPVGLRPGTRPPARPRIEPEPAILGLSRHTRSRLGSRLFNLFFVFVFALIAIQMVVSLLAP